MASLHKDPRGKSPFWYISYRTPDKRQHFKSTGETDHQKAIAYKASIEEGLKKAKVGALTGVRARSLISDLLREVTGQNLAFESIEDNFRTSLRRVQNKGRISTFDRYRG